MTVAAALELLGVDKRFGDVTALAGATLHVRPGTIHAVLGENGAGKSTLMRIAYGMTAPDAGEVRVAGQLVRFDSPLDAIRAGIGMVHQHFTLVPSMTVAENLALGGRGRLDRSAIRARTSELARRTGFALDPDARVETLPVGAQQRLEITKAIARDPAVLILDEPTAVLTPAEVDELLTWLRAYARDGHAVVLITHKLREAIAVSDDVTVMRAGRVVLHATAGAVNETLLTEAMLGAQTASGAAKAHATPAADGPPVFLTRGLYITGDDGRPLVDDVDLSVRAGEIVGIAAVEGSGQHELLATLAGRRTPAAGQLEQHASVAYIPEDRHRDAVLLDRDLTENVVLRNAGSRSGVIDWASWRERTTALMSAFDVRAENASVPMRTLSGGNQQKLVLARELGTDSGMQAIVADNATRGLDVRAAATVHARLRDAAAAGAAVILYSNDIDEVLAIATRVFVIHNRALREVEPQRDVVGRAMLGADL